MDTTRHEASVRVCCVFPGELSAVRCFVHKTTRIVGGGPVGISEGSWMVSIQKGYRDAVNILHISPEEEQFFHPLGTRASQLWNQ